MNGGCVIAVSQEESAHKYFWMLLLLSLEGRGKGIVGSGKMIQPIKKPRTIKKKGGGVEKKATTIQTSFLLDRE